ncbi:hypothetical protein HK101_001820 [Irineochytrium annulatum]|nr:hypothetical protein HK101_001820 [Irineochytrium annulatum]
MKAAAGMYTTDALVKVMKKASADIELIPLLAAVLPGFVTAETERTAALDGSARDIQLKSIVSKIIAAFVESTAAIFIFDDIQWLDSSTLEVLIQISKLCPQVNATLVFSEGLRGADFLAAVVKASQGFRQ